VRGKGNGRGRPPRPMLERYWEKVDKSEDGCWNWTSALDGWGYGVFFLKDRSCAFKAHRLSWEIHFGPIPEGMLICHHCDNPKCVRPDHLFVGTPKDNIRDCVNKGRWIQPPQPHKSQIQRGEKVCFAKLTAEKVFQIRRLALKGVSCYRMSKWIPLSYRGIKFIIDGVNWAHVPFPRHERDTLQEAMVAL